VSEAGTGDGLPPKRFLIDELWLRRFVGARILAPAVRFVQRTSKVQYEPADHLTASAALEPAIYVTWHANLLAQVMMVHRTDHLVNMTAPHPDGRMAGALSEALGATTIVAAGISERQKTGTGSIAGFRAMLRALKSGKSLMMAGEVPPIPGRNVAPGIVAVARLSGRPIIPVAAASSRRWVVEKLWDKMQVNLPFSSVHVVASAPIWVGKDDDDADVMARIKSELDRIYARALEKADADRR
jgi:lysophospholipid acyltransferase (LPLAT)-like uncharacterized protein